MAGRLRYLLAVLCCMVTLSGCGSDSSSPVVSSTPQNGATNFILGHAPMEVTVAKDLDPSTVNGSTVTLRGRDSFTGRSFVTSGVVNYNSRTRTITFAPSWGYSNNGSYALKLAGLKDAAGNPLPETSISFTTAKVMQTLQASGLDVVYADGSSAGFYYRTIFDADGNPTRSIHYSGAGTDNVWFTGNDQIDSYTDSTFDSTSKTIQYVYHYSAGPDGIWFTADDPVDSYTVYTYSDGKDITVTYKGAGGDGAWFTADDTVSGYRVAVYNTDGSMSSMISYSSPGPDSRWFTADDVYDNYNTYLYGANGNLTRQAHSNGAGPDGIPFTADDTAILNSVTDSYDSSTTSYSPGFTYQTTTYDANNRPLSWAVYDNPGPDGVWFTPDDVYNYYSTSLYDADGRLARRAISLGVGPDGIPFTADDSYNILVSQTSSDGGSSTVTQTAGNAVHYLTYSYDAQGNLVRYVAYNDPGPDGVWFNADDKISNYSAFSLNSAGKPERRTDYYGGPGPDGVWFTDDDTINAYYDYTYDATGNQVRLAGFSVGPDGVAFTADDEPYYYNVTAYDTQGRISSSTSYRGHGPDGVWFSTDDSLSSKYEYVFLP